MGRHCKRLLLFAITYLRRGDWHCFGKDRQTVRAVKWCEKHGFLEVDWENRSFRLPGAKYDKLEVEI